MKDYRQVLVRLGLFVTVVLIFGIMYAAEPRFFSTAWIFITQRDLGGLADYIHSFGHLAVVFSFLLTVLFNAIGFPPAMIFSASCTLIFGIVPGILLAWVAETVGAGISFLFFRTFLRDTAEGLIQKNKTLRDMDKKSETDGFKVMLVARLIPYFPAAALNAFGALSKMSFKDYMISSFLGKFPATAIEALVGHDAVLPSPLGHWRLAIVSVITAVMYLAFWLWNRKVAKSEK